MTYIAHTHRSQVGALHNDDRLRHTHKQNACSPVEDGTHCNICLWIHFQSFFKRMVKKPPPTQACDGDCVPQPGRAQCIYCRYARCVQAGMCTSGKSQLPPIFLPLCATQRTAEERIIDALGDSKQKPQQHLGKISLPCCLVKYRTRQNWLRYIRD